MKTSTKIFLGSLVLLGAGLMSYDFQLDAAFRKGGYTKPYYNYDSLNYTGFDRIELNSSTALNIMLVRGDYKVLIHPGMEDFLKIRQDGSKLIIDARFPDHYRGIFGDYLLYISCPELKGFHADSRYAVAGVETLDRRNSGIWNRPTLISGFRLDSVAITAEHAGNVVLDNDTVGSMRAMLSGNASLTIGPGNAFGHGDLEVMNEAQLYIKIANARNLDCHLADSAGLYINGAAVKQLLKIN